MKWAVQVGVVAIVHGMALAASSTAHALPDKDVICAYSKPGEFPAPPEQLLEAFEAQVQQCIADLRGLFRLDGSQFVVKADHGVETRLPRPQYSLTRPIAYDHGRRLLFVELRAIHTAVHFVVDTSNGGSTMILSLPQYSPGGRWGLSREYAGYPPARNVFKIFDFSHHPPRLAFERKWSVEDGLLDQLTLTLPVWEGNDRVRFSLQIPEVDGARKPFAYRSAVVERKGDTWRFRLDRQPPAWNALIKSRSANRVDR